MMQTCNSGMAVRQSRRALQKGRIPELAGLADLRFPASQPFSIYEHYFISKMN
jgi:hypothetical protein